MAAPNLKDNINQWVNIEVSLNNETSQGEIFINGTPQGNPFVIDAQITKDENSKIFIGSDKDGNNGFQGKMEAVGIQNKAVTAEVSRKKYERSRDNDHDKLFMMELDQDRLIGDDTFSDLGAGRMKGTFDATTSDSEFVEDVAQKRGGLKFNSVGHISVPDPSKRLGKASLENGCSFTSWIKCPSSASLSGFKPIITKENLFTFGISNGHAALYLSHDGQYAPGTNVEKVDNYKLRNKLLAKLQFEKSDPGVKYFEGTTRKPLSLQQVGVRRSKALVLGNDKKVTYSKKALIGEDLSKFSVSMWVKPSSLSTATLINRVDAGLELKYNSSGRITLIHR